MRSANMVRITDPLTIEQQFFSEELVRKTRILYESLRIYLLNQDHNQLSRFDLKAGSLMNDQGLWLHRDKRIIGTVPGVNIGDVFTFRMELCVLGVHGHCQAGIDYVPSLWNMLPIATSIVVSGGYEDDEDMGDVIVYTGQGGQQRGFGRQCGDQKMEGGNLALVGSMVYGFEIRVIRRITCGNAPTGKIYVYDGLYRVDSYWFDIGKSGFGVYKYNIVRIPNQPEMGSFLFTFVSDLRSNRLNVGSSGYICSDISKGRERFPVSVYNDVDSDDEPVTYEYAVKPMFSGLVILRLRNDSVGCQCVSDCSDGCHCAIRNGGEFPYDTNRILLRGKSLIFECGPHCQCPPSCRNRVSQKGMKYPMEIFKSRETGCWGVRSLDFIPAGSFICEFTGMMLARQQEEMFAVDDENVFNPNRFPGRWDEWGDISEVYPEVVRSTGPLVPPLEFVVDVSETRNVACYFSDSGTPNVMVQFVLHDHNSASYPHLMFFATENIPPLRDLTVNYGV